MIRPKEPWLGLKTAANALVPRRQTLAKKDYSTPDQGRVKFRVIEFEVEGANATLTEGMRNIAAAIQRASLGGRERNTD